METEDKPCVPISCVPEDTHLLRILGPEGDLGYTTVDPAYLVIDDPIVDAGVMQRRSGFTPEEWEQTHKTLIDHNSAGPTLRSQMKQKQREFSKGGRWIVGKRGEAVPLTEKQFIATSDRVSARRRERGGNTRFTPKADK